MAWQTIHSTERPDWPAPNLAHYDGRHVRIGREHDPANGERAMASMQSRQRQEPTVEVAVPVESGVLPGFLDRPADARDWFVAHLGADTTPGTRQ